MSDNVDNINYKSIRCTEIPELFLDKLVAKKHFSRFGKITRFILYPQRLSCTIEYETEDAAERALMEGSDFHGHSFTIQYAQREVGHVHTTEEWVDPDVQAELEAMGAASAMHMRATLPVALKPLPVRTPKPPTAAATKPAKAEVIAVAAPKIDAAVRGELEALLRRPAYSDEDKYRVLDARDKLIRLRTVRQTDIKKAVSTRGTCPDMCPEKERLMREYQRQVSSFETDGSSSTISHRRAVKEYSRSSADQEVPLPHELRSESVLQMTMLYLMHRIMDLCDDAQTSISDWFHFVWDRTRSIRKDITQQELCSVGVVELVEQCARFHIHCAARLVAEEPSVFDKKINAENLTKCLQTLKYMYHDLRIKHEICPNEAEFRGYIILLNLGDANFLWEVKQLPTHIQNSPAIRRAIAFYNALQNNNYVRFFDMMRQQETSYMSACILLSYVNKLRYRALEVIYKAHNWRKASTVLPLSHLTNVLGFEDDLTAADFFQYHGWQCDDERVILDSVKRPDLEYSMERALLLVESKRTVSVGECVCGHQLSSASIFEAHEPHNSFDANGYLRAESWTANDQLRGDALAHSQKTQALTAPPQQAQPQFKGAHVNGQATANVPAAAMPKANNNIFKVPQASPPISAKQQQQKLISTPTSLFDDAKLMAKEKNSLQNNTDDSSSAFKSLPPTGLFGQSLFKPMAAATNDAPPQMSFNNIFSAAVQETRNLFQPQASSANETLFVKPQPAHASNIFQNSAAFPSPMAVPFMPTAAHTAQYELDEARKRQEQAELAERLAQAERRKRELEEEQRLKQLQLNEERQRLKLLEEQRAREQQAKLEEARRQKQLAELAVQAQHVTDELLNELLSAEIDTLVRDELCTYQNFEQHCYELCQQILADEVRANVEAIAQEEYAIMCHDQMIVYKYLNRWIAHTRNRIAQRKLIETLPIWATSDSREQQTAQLRHPNECANLEMIKRYRHGQPCDFSALLSSQAQQSTAASVDIFHIFRCHNAAAASAAQPRHERPSVQTIKYCKIVFTLPDENEELPGFESLCNKWLRKYLKIPAASAAEQPHAAYINRTEANVALCVRKLSGALPRNERGQRARDEYDNAHALIVFMSCTNVQSTRRRLHHLLKLSNNQRGIPVAFVVYDAEDCDEQQLAAALQLEHLLADGKIGKYKFCGCCEPRNQFHFHVHLGRALRFVARNCDARSDMEMQSLQCCMDSCLGEEMWRRWQQSTLENPLFAKLCATPQNVIALYNEALDRVIGFAMKDWQMQPDFPHELRELLPPRCDSDVPRGVEYFPADWKSAVRQEHLHKFLQLLRLPQCDAQLPADVDGWELWLLNYASACLPADDVAATEAAYEAIKVFIELLNDAQTAPATIVHDSLPAISFLPVIKKLVFCQINYVLRHSPVAQRVPGEVFYQRVDYSAYHDQPWWLNIQPIEAVTIEYSTVCEPSADVVDLAAQQERQFEELQQVLQQAEQISRRVEESFNVLKQQSNNSMRESSRVNDLRRELDESLYQFEVSKQIGAYDVSFSHDAVEEQENKSPPHVREKPATGRGAHGKKRKHADGYDETDLVITKAFDLIHKVEAQQDQRRRLRLDQHFSMTTK